MASPASNVEVELKLRVSPEGLAALAKHPVVTAVRRGRSKREALSAVYFDTPEHALRDAGVALRIRREHGRWVQTYKAAATDANGGGGLTARLEIHHALPDRRRRPSLAVDPLRDSPVKALAKAARKGTLRPAFATRFTRTALPIGFDDGTRALLCLDQGEVRTLGNGRIRRARICEVEIELATGDVRRLFDFARAISAEVPAAVEPASKAERGYALLHAGRVPATRAARVAVGAGATAAEWIAGVTGDCVRQIERNADGVLRHRDPEYVHQMRVGARRLRSAITLVAPHLPEGTVAALDAEVRWIAATLGELRDLDVLVDDTLPPLLDRADAPLGRFVEPLAVLAENERRAARRQVRRAILSPRFTALLLALGAWRNQRALGADDKTPEGVVLVAPAIEFARHVLSRRHRKLLRRGDRIEHATPEERHRVRIAAKRLRYAAEFAAALFDAKAVPPFIEALGALQDVLGRGNDATVALGIASRLCGAQSPATSALAGWSAAQGVLGERRLRKAWNRFVETPQFWR